MVDILIEVINALPRKNVIKALVSDTDKYLAVLELIDNSYTSWIAKGQSSNLSVSISFSPSNRSMMFRDNAGGMNKQELIAFLSPGETTSVSDGKGISLFGVGAKRSSFFLSMNFSVLTRRGESETLKVVVEKDWLSEQDNWKHKLYSTDNIEPNTTVLQFENISFSVDAAYLQELKHRIESTYSLVLGKRFSISVDNERLISPNEYEWLSTQSVKPVKHVYHATVRNMQVAISFTVGLLTKGSQVGQYGFDIVCNGRQVAKDLKDPEIGFRDTELGKPHPKLARFKGIVDFEGAQSVMPWNSTKSGLDYSSKTFLMVKDRLIMHSKPYTRESSRMAYEKDSKNSGGSVAQVEEIDHGNIDDPVNDYPLPPPEKNAKPTKPKMRKTPLTSLQQAKIAYKALLTKDDLYAALIEGVYAARKISDSKFDFKDRFALILIDNTCELILKRYIREQKGMTAKQADGYFANKSFRNYVDDAKVFAGKSVSDVEWAQILKLREIRNNLNHQHSDLTVPPNTIRAYEKILVNLFDVFFEVDLKP